MKILLTYQSGHTDRSEPYINLVPTGLCYLHACLHDATYESRLANFSAWSPTKIKKELARFKPAVIGISQWTHNRHASMELARICRTTLPDCVIIMGGGHATFCYEDALYEGSPVNIVVRGEGEATLLELASALKQGNNWQTVAGLAFHNNGQIVITPDRPLIDDLDSLPLPAQFLDRSIGIDLDLQAEFVVTTRGCPSACYFCSSPDFWGKKVRFRSPQAIVDEISAIHKMYGLIYFSIRDDTFTADRKRVLQFCDLLQQRNLNILWNCQSRVTAIDEELVLAMKRAGCECIQLGIESGSPRILTYLGKKITEPQIRNACAIIKSLGVNLSIYLISDVPDETAEDIKLTVNLIKQIKPDDGYISPLAYFPGTRLYMDAVAAKKTSSRIFAETLSEAIYAHRSGNSAKVLMKAMTNGSSNSDRFARQKTRLGYCYTTNIIAGEWHRNRDEFSKAEAEFKEITEQQPDNAWGWLLLGDLYSEVGQRGKSQNCYKQVLAIVPNHAPAKRALADFSK
jgi:radical SAM superfamily enzyme YgiQ (UPF0313 family)